MLDNSVKNRITYVIKVATGIAACGLIYLCFVRLTGMGIPCMFNYVTGLKCPGCGVTRMFVCIAELDFEGAFRCNQLVSLMLIPGGIYGICKLVEYIKNGYVRTSKFENFIYVVILICAVAFGIMRNIMHL